MSMFGQMPKVLRQPVPHQSHLPIVMSRMPAVQPPVLF